VQRLHVVGFTKDHEGLILSARRGTKTGGYTVDVDGGFEEVLAELMKERGVEAEPRLPRAESQLSVREMQQRLRSGQTIHQVARAAGVTDEWVARFAVPIQAEQTQVIRQAFDLTFSKQRLGVSSQPLGVSVWWNLQDKSANLDEEQWESGWTAFLVRDTQWVVRFEYESRNRNQIAEWEVDLRAATLSSRNRLATDLGFVESGRRRRPGPPTPVAGGLVTRPAPPVESPPPAPAPEPEPVVEAGAPAPAKKRAARRPTVKKSSARKVAPKKVAARKPTPKKARAKKSAPKKSAPKRSAPKRSAPKKAATRKKVAGKKAPARRKAAGNKAPRKAAPKKAAPKKSAPARATTRPPVPTPNVAAVHAPVVSGTRVGTARPSEFQPVLTPPPAPSGTRRRLFGRR